MKNPSPPTPPPPPINAYCLLSIDGRHFGSHLTVKINVLDPANIDGAETEKNPRFGWKCNPQKKKTVKTNLTCICDSTLMYLDVKQAYKGKKVYCDFCSHVCKQYIFHCPVGDDKEHSGGYDLCYSCGRLELTEEYILRSLAYGAADATAYPSLKQSVPPALTANHQRTSILQMMAQPIE